MNTSSKSSTHLCIQPSSHYKDTILDTVNENVKKARRTFYSLLSTFYMVKMD